MSVKKCIYIVGESFQKLAKHTLNYKTVIFVNCSNIKSYDPPPAFLKTENIAIIECDDDFVYDWMKPSLFPSLKNIYLNSNPVESSVFKRFEPQQTPIYLHEKFKIYRYHWQDMVNLNNVKILSNINMEQSLTEISIDSHDEIQSINDYKCDIIYNIQNDDGKLITVSYFDDVYHICENIDGNYDNFNNNLTHFIPALGANR
jgi:hypothetical protein